MLKLILHRLSTHFQPQTILMSALLLSGLSAPPVIAAGAPPGVINNQATGSFVDDIDTTNTVVPIESNTVQVTVAEVAGITISDPTVTEPSAATIGVTAAPFQGIGGINQDDILYFDFVITNAGNDPSQFFIPGSPLPVTNGTFDRALYGAVKIITVKNAAGTTTASPNVDVPAAGGFTGDTGILGIPGGAIPANGSVTVRIPIKVTGTSGSSVKVTLGDTGTNDNSATTSNQIYTASSTTGADVRTKDNSNNTALNTPVPDEATGVLTTAEEKEASRFGTANIVALPLLGFKSVKLTDTNGDTKVNPLETVTWTINYVNRGTTDITNFQITDVLPVGTTKLGTPTISVNSGQTLPTVNTLYTGTNTVPNTTDRLFTSAVTLKAGGRITVTIPATVNGGITGTLANQAIAKADTLPLSGINTDNAGITADLPTDIQGTPYNVVVPIGSISQTITTAIDPTQIVAALPSISISGTIFNDFDASVTKDTGDLGTNAGSANLTVYAIVLGKVVDKATVSATDGTYTLSLIPANTAVTLRLSNDSSILLLADAPTTPSLPTSWFHTGENLDGTRDGAIATLGDISVTTTTINLSNYNFGIRQSYVITDPPVPTTCAANFATNLNTGVSSSSGQLAIGTNDSNWTVEWIAGPASGTGTPYSIPRPVGVMPAVVTGNLAPGAWIAEPTNSRWISYPFRLTNNSNGNHQDANLNGTNNEKGSLAPNDTVRLKFTAKLTLPSNANSIAVSLPVGVSVDNRFVSLKVNNTENLVPTPAQDPEARDYETTQLVNIQNGWQPGVNTIEIIVDSGPDRTGFFLAVTATTTQICPNNPNLLLVKRITKINDSTNTNSGDNLALYKDEGTNPYDDNNVTITNPVAPIQADTNKWPISSGQPFMIGGTDGGRIKPNDSIEYTIYFLSTGEADAKKVLFCDRVPNNVTFIENAFNSSPLPGPQGLGGGDRGIVVSIGTNNAMSYTNVGGDDIARYYPPTQDPIYRDYAQFFPGVTDPLFLNKKICDGSNNNGAVVVNLGTIPKANSANNDPPESAGFVRFQGRVK